MAAQSQLSARILDLLSDLLADGTVQAEASEGPDGVAAGPGGVVTAFTCYVQYIDADGDTAWMVLYAPEQSLVQTAGHVAHLYAITDEKLRRSCWYGDEDDG